MIKAGFFYYGFLKKYSFKGAFLIMKDMVYICVISHVSFAFCFHVSMHIRDDWFDNWFALCKLATPVSLLFLLPTFLLLNVLMPVTSFDTYSRGLW